MDGLRKGMNSLSQAPRRWTIRTDDDVVEKKVRPPANRCRGCERELQHHSMRYCGRLCKMRVRRQQSEMVRQTPERYLSLRERQILSGTLEGKPNKAIAADLNLSPKTIDTYRVALMTKLDVSNRVELVKLALRLGWIAKDAGPEGESVTAGDIVRLRSSLDDARLKLREVSEAFERMDRMLQTNHENDCCKNYTRS